MGRGGIGGRFRNERAIRSDAQIDQNSQRQRAPMTIR
jgi:hypothetical protein